MQTFLPYPGFRDSARVLDQRRLGKQRVEALQVLRGLTVPGYGWRHHPAVKMWTGYVEGLVRYGLEMCVEWTRTGRADTVAATLLTEYGSARTEEDLRTAGELPPWLGMPELHLSHRSSLVRKDPAYYLPIFGPTDDTLPYVWPTSDRTAPAAVPGT